MERKDRQHANELRQLEERLGKRLTDEITSLEERHKQEMDDLRRELGGTDPDEVERLTRENENQVAEIQRLTSELGDQRAELAHRDDIITEQEETIQRLEAGGSAYAPWYERPGRWVRGRLHPRTRRRVTTEEIEYGRTEDRRAGAALMVGVAALAAVGLAYLWGEHEEHEHQHPVPSLIEPGPHRVNDPTAGLGRRHVLRFRNGKAFKVSLPGNLKAKLNANGSYRLDDIEGHVVVPRLYADRQGNMDQDSRKLVRTDPHHNFVLKQNSYPYHTPGTNYDSHYETVVLNG
jgi:hypothetical protein